MKHVQKQRKQARKSQAFRKDLSQLNIKPRVLLSNSQILQQ